MVVVHSSSEQNKLREAGRIVALVHKELKQLIKVGISTLELDTVARDLIDREGGVPAFLGYKGFPFTICASVNRTIIHGFPNVRKLEEGDIVSIDVGVKKEGYYGDAAFSMQVGEGTEEIQRLIDTSNNTLNEAINVIKAGVTTGTVGRIIEEYAASYGYSMVHNYIGHGIGRQLHMEPPIYNYGRDCDGIKLKEGMCICIEPMLCVGSSSNYRLPDGWSVVTEDGSMSAHVEHQVIVHKDYAEIIT
ncbi:type I methionyl aminopeptidase [bacterium]|nr:type I methionyl aminopeptidase [bacterium]